MDISTLLTGLQTGHPLEALGDRFFLLNKAYSGLERVAQNVQNDPKAASMEHLEKQAGGYGSLL